MKIASYQVTTLRVPEDDPLANMPEEAGRMRPVDRVDHERDRQQRHELRIDRVAREREDDHGEEDGRQRGEERGAVADEAAEDEKSEDRGERDLDREQRPRREHRPAAAEQQVQRRLLVARQRRKHIVEVAIRHPAVEDLLAVGLVLRRVADLPVRVGVQVEEAPRGRERCSRAFGIAPGARSIYPGDNPRTPGTQRASP